VAEKRKAMKNPAPGASATSTENPGKIPENKNREHIVGMDVPTEGPVASPGSSPAPVIPAGVPEAGSLPGEPGSSSSPGEEGGEAGG
jgi:hypothetical protein